MQDKHKRLVVVDDEPDILEFLKVVLEDEGYAVVTSEKGEYLEQLHNSDLPDLILLDVLLSGKDGRQIAQYLKSQAETRHIPIIMFSAHTGIETAVRKAGAEDFLSKPFDIGDLLSKVAMHLVNI